MAKSNLKTVVVAGFGLLALAAILPVGSRWVVEVFREPDVAAGLYRSTHTARRGETLRAATLPGVSVAVAALFPEDPR